MSDFDDPNYAADVALPFHSQERLNLDQDVFSLTGMAEIYPDDKQNLSKLLALLNKQVRLSNVFLNMTATKLNAIERTEFKSISSRVLQADMNLQSIANDLYVIRRRLEKRHIVKRSVRNRKRR